MLTKPLLLCVLALSVVPAFVNTDSFKVNLISILLDTYPQGYFMHGINIHIGTILDLIVLATMPYLFFLRIVVLRFVVPDVCVILLIIFMTLSVLAGLTADANFVNIAFYFQTLAPIAMYFVGAHLVRNITLLETIPAGVAILTTMTISVMLLFLATQGMLFSSPAISAYNLAIVFPQAKDLYPLVYFMSAFFIIYNFCRRFGFSARLICYLIMAIVHASFIYYLWARGAFLGAAVGIALIIIFELREIRKMRSRTAALGQLMLVYAIVVVAMSSILFFTTIGILAERYSEGSVLEESDSTRVELAFGALERIVESPILGNMFIPELDVKVGETEKLDIMRLFPAHNQYLDYALRGGVQSAILLIVLVMWGICEGLRAYPAGSLPRDIDILRRYLGAFLVMAAIGSLFQLYFVQNISASITWLCVGILARLHIERKKSIAVHGYRAGRCAPADKLSCGRSTAGRRWQPIRPTRSLT